jgi:hypothetical protein
MSFHGLLAITFKHQMTCHCLNVPQFIHSFIERNLGRFQDFSNYGENFHKYSEFLCGHKFLITLGKYQEVQLVRMCLVL